MNIKNKHKMNKIGIIGGTGLYGIEGFTKQKWVSIKTPFGNPSDKLLTGELCGREVVFLPRPVEGITSCPENSTTRLTSGL
jgi:purine nucleoside phosphorylase